MEGKKSDEGKRRWDLLPAEAVEQIVDVLAFGAAKYGDENWRRVPMAERRYFAALMRHVWSWWKGEEMDKETGLPHLAHAGCCLLFLLEIGRRDHAADTTERP